VHLQSNVVSRKCRSVTWMMSSKLMTDVQTIAYIIDWSTNSCVNYRLKYKLSSKPLTDGQTRSRKIVDWQLRIVQTLLCKRIVQTLSCKWQTLSNMFTKDNSTNVKRTVDNSQIILFLCCTGSIPSMQDLNLYRFGALLA